MKKILIVFILIMILAGCGLENDIITTMATGGLDDGGNIPESVSLVDTWFDDRTVLGENLLLTWEVIFSGSAAENEFFQISSLFDQSEVEIYKGDETEPFLTGITETHISNRMYGCWFDSPNFDTAESYSWRVRLAGGSDGSSYHGAWYGPFDLEPESTIILDLEESTGYGGFDYEFLGSSPAILADGNDVYAAFITGEDQMDWQSSISGGSWSSISSSVVNGEVSYRQGDTIKVLKDSSDVFHIMKAVGGVLEHFTWSSGEGALSLIQFNGSDSLDYESHHKPSMAIDGDDAVYFLYYTEESPYTLSVVSSADSYTASVVVDSGAGYYENYGDTYEGVAKLLVDGDGNLHAIYTSWADVYLSHSVSTDNGGTWTVPTRIKENDFAWGLDAAVSGEAIYVSFIGPDPDDTYDARLRSLYLAEYTPDTVPADGIWSTPEEISNSVWMNEGYGAKSVPAGISLDSTGTPCILAVMTTGDFEGSDPPSGVFPAPCPALWREGTDGWEKHWLDIGTATNYAENYYRDPLHLDFDIDSEDNFHFIFKEISDPLPSDYDNEVAVYVKYLNLGLSDLDFN